jgi:uncharacterized membrane protein HdeD (DUF308 family)
MSVESEPESGDMIDTGAAPAHAPWGLAVFFGVTLVILGTVAVTFALATTLATVFVIGIFLLVGGAVHLVTGFATRGRRLWLNLLVGFVYLVAGVLMIERPLAAAEAFTLMLAVAFLVGGLFRIVVAIGERFEGRIWVFLNGVITLALGVMIWRQWPASGLWVIGLFVGIDLIIAGWSCIMAGLAVRSLKKKLGS